MVDGRVRDGPAGDDGRVADAEGVPEGADEVDGDGETGVRGIAKGDVATAVDSQGRGDGGAGGEEQGDAERQQRRHRRRTRAGAKKGRRIGKRKGGIPGHQAGSIGGMWKPFVIQASI